MPKDIFLFSSKFKELGIFLKFSLLKFWKIFILIFKWNKNIQPIQLSYLRDWRFEKSYLIIHFKFKNAVWYKLKSIQRVSCTKPIILNLENLKENKVEFIVYGFLRKKIYVIDTSKSETLSTNNFKTSISKINTIKEIDNRVKFKLRKPILERQHSKIKLDDIKTNFYPIEITFNNYNQKEFI